ncbi:hypothetical protein J506_1382 [Acinetobacter baumannii 625974]|uniref:Uncharacterized protein n=1 Tax=Acinetobacter baumannii 625974 TaxID=1310607 RepID=A0A009QDM9_ACIBA|nr:hypothetical protein J506_1382 [Acinetobacter baumannii 625974]
MYTAHFDNKNHAKPPFETMNGYLVQNSIRLNLILQAPAQNVADKNSP